jgi:hypothetical protein
MESIRPTYNQRDALLKKLGVFPTAAGTTYTEAHDLGDIGQRGVRIDPFELVIEAPALTATQLPAGADLAYSFQFCDVEDFSDNVETVEVTEWKQTGSTSGAGAFEARFRVATDGRRFVRAKCVRTGTGGSLTAVNYTFDFVT